MNTTIDTTAIRAEWEPRKRSAIHGVEFENDDATTVLAMCDEIDALQRANELRAKLDNTYIERLHNEIVALKMQMDADRDTCRNAIREVEDERDALRERIEPEYRAMAQEIERLRAKLSGGASNA